MQYSHNAKSSMKRFICRMRRKLYKHAYEQARASASNVRRSSIMTPRLRTQPTGLRVAYFYWCRIFDCEI